MQQTVMASKFKAQCLALLDQVRMTKKSLVVTKHGKPVARLVPIDEPTGATTAGSVELLAEDDSAYFSTEDAWEADGTTAS